MSKYRERQDKEYEVEDAVRALTNGKPGISTVPRQGARRPRVRIAKGFQPYLTERQRVILGGRARMPRAWGRIMAELHSTGMTMEEFVETLSPEELVRGQVKDKNGRFAGRPPQFVPRAFHRACVAELMRRGRYLWQDNYLKAIETMTKIAAGEGPAGEVATPGERIKAAQFVIERLEGKIPERVIVSDEHPWQLVLDGIVAEVSDTQLERGQKALESAQAVRQELMDDPDIVDAEIVEEEPAPPRRRRSTTVRRR